MKAPLQRFNKRRGVLTFEWVLLITLLVIGAVGGVSAIRDALISEMGDIVGAVVAIDQSYSVLATDISGLGNEFGFDDPDPDCDGSGSRDEPSPADQTPMQYCPQ